MSSFPNLQGTPHPFYMGVSPPPPSPPPQDLFLGTQGTSEHQTVDVKHSQLTGHQTFNLHLLQVLLYLLTKQDGAGNLEKVNIVSLGHRSKYLDLS